MHKINETLVDLSKLFFFCFFFDCLRFVQYYGLKESQNSPGWKGPQNIICPTLCGRESLCEVI